MKIKLLGIATVMTGLAFVACGDDGSGEGGSGGSGTTTTTSTKSTTGTMGTTTSTTTGGAMCALSDTTAPTTCAEACSVVYDCGALTCNGMNLCMFDGSAAEKMQFVGDAMSGCIEGCMAQMALIQLVNPGRCDTTINTLKGLNAEFQMACDNGISGTTAATTTTGGGG